MSKKTAQSAKPNPPAKPAKPTKPAPSAQSTPSTPSTKSAKSAKSTKSVRPRPPAGKRKSAQVVAYATDLASVPKAIEPTDPADPITYGYVRVSSKDQNEARQVIAMHEFGIDDAHIIVEKMSGKNFNRPEYLALLKRLRPDDVLVVQSIDRLGRNYEEILQQWSDLTKVYHVGIVVLDMPLLDTRKGRDLTGRLVADLVLQIFSYVAQQEREHIRKRQAEGIAAAKARGIRFGRERLSLPPTFVAFAEQWAQKKVSARSAARNLGISTQTFLRRAREYYSDYAPESVDFDPESSDLPAFSTPSVRMVKISTLGNTQKKKKNFFRGNRSGLRPAGRICNFFGRNSSISMPKCILCGNSSF